MARLFTVLLGLSLTGGALTLAVAALTPLTRRWFSAAWHRAVHCVALAFYAVPAGLFATAACRALLPTGAPVLDALPDFPLPLENLALPPAAAQPAAFTWTSLLWLAPVVWAVVALALLLRHLLALRRFRLDMRRLSAPVTAPPLLDALESALRDTRCRGGLRLLESPAAHSPMLTLPGPGSRRPALVLPSLQWEPGELALVLRHELTHHMHRDLWVKLAGSLLCAVHWFNPAVYLLTRRLDRWMELACDEAVVRGMDLQQRRGYGRTILNVLSRTQDPGAGVRASFCENTAHIKERLKAMLHKKPLSKKTKHLSVAALALLCGAGVLLGVSTYSEAAVLPSPAVPNLSNAAPADGAPQAALTDSVDLPAAGPTQFLWPIDAKIPMTTYKNHAGNGVDLAPGGGGHPVYASAAAVVSKVQEGNTGYGIYIILDHGGGYQTVYAHLESAAVSVGDTVAAGQEIAKIGRSGNATSHHLHFEVRKDGSYMHPQDYINADNTPVSFP